MSLARSRDLKNQPKLSVGVISRGNHLFQLWLAQHIELLRSEIHVEWLFATQSDSWKNDFPLAEEVQAIPSCTFFEISTLSVNEMRLLLCDASKASLHVFLDDDVFMSKESVEQIIMLHFEYPHARAIGGYYTHPSSPKPVDSAYNSFCNLWLDLSLQNIAELKPFAEGLVRTSNLLGGNWSFKKSSEIQIDIEHKSGLEGDEREIFQRLAVPLYFHLTHGLVHRPCKELYPLILQIFKQALAKDNLPITDGLVGEKSLNQKVRLITTSIIRQRSLRNRLIFLSLLFSHSFGRAWSRLTLRSKPEKPAQHRPGR